MSENKKSLEQLIDENQTKKSALKKIVKGLEPSNKEKEIINLNFKKK